MNVNRLAMNTHRVMTPGIVHAEDSTVYFWHWIGDGGTPRWQFRLTR